MGRFIKGEIVILPFPFSDYSSSKKRPALVIAELSGDDVILCMITTQRLADDSSVSLSQADFISGTISQDCAIRPNRLFTTDSNIIIKSAGRLSMSKIIEVENKIIEIIRS